MRKRSKYRPKGVRLDVVNYVLNGLKPIAVHEAAVDLRIKNHASMDSLVKGVATRHDMDILIAALNITEALACLDPELGGDWRQEINDGQDALYNVAKRGAANNRFILTGLEMKALNLVMEIHDAQLDKATVLQLDRATQYINEQIRLKKVKRVA